MPASESPDAFGSPVPAYTVRPVESFGSTVTVPMALVAKLLEMNCQFALSPASALVVLQSPPPAAPRYSVQLFAVHVGPIASAVMRPEATY